MQNILTFGENFKYKVPILIRFELHQKAKSILSNILWSIFFNFFFRFPIIFEQHLTIITTLVYFIICQFRISHTIIKDNILIEYRVMSKNDLNA